MEDWPRDCELFLVEKLESLQEDLFGDAGGCGREAARAGEGLVLSSAILGSAQACSRVENKQNTGPWSPVHV